MRGRITTRPRTLPGWIAAPLSTMVLVAALEGSSYLFGRIPLPENPLRGNNLSAFGQYDPLLFWSLRPGALGPDGLPQINSLGLRGPELAAKTRDEVRTLSLGESTTFGARVRYEEGYSQVLERLLALDQRVAPERVINAGVPGYTLLQGYQYLKHRGVALQPDVVMIYFGLNDSLPVTYVADRVDVDDASAGLDDWSLFDLRQSRVERLKTFLLTHSNLYRGMHAAGTDDAEPAEGRIRTNTQRPRVPAAHRERLLEMLLQLCLDHGMTLVIVIPWYREFEGHIPVLRRFASSNRVEVVDLPAMLPPRLTRPRSEYFLDGGHPTAEGHRLMAEAIHEVRAREGAATPAE